MTELVPPGPGPLRGSVTVEVVSAADSPTIADVVLVAVAISVKVAVGEDESAADGGPSSGSLCGLFGTGWMFRCCVVILADDDDDDVITPRKWDTGRGRDFGMDLLEQQSVINTTDDSMMNSVA